MDDLTRKRQEKQERAARELHARGEGWALLKHDGLAEHTGTTEDGLVMTLISEEAGTGVAMSAAAARAYAAVLLASADYADRLLAGEVNYGEEEPT